MPIALLPIILTIISSLFVLVNFIAYLAKGRILTRPIIWQGIQGWVVVILPILFLIYMDLPYQNDCCVQSAIFSPEHRPGIYILIFLCIIAYTVNIFRAEILAPVAELMLNVMLILGLILNVLFCIHFTTTDEGMLFGLFGNVPIVMLLLITMAENQKLLKKAIDSGAYRFNTRLGKIGVSILNQKPILKYPILTVLLIPILLLLSLLLLLFGQKPDSLILAFTDTYHHGFSQLDHLCENVACGGHFLCSVGANGHPKIVKPIRYGERNGRKIICTRQLLVSNAFEELVQEKCPLLHKIIRHNYNKVGRLIHRYYGIFNNKYISDLVYIGMKPLELLFLWTLYTFDKRPENRIAKQYLAKSDLEAINGGHWLPIPDNSRGAI